MDLSKHLENAAQAVKRRNYASAVTMYSRLLALQPDNGEARAGLRTALFKKAEQKKPSKLFALLGGGIHLLIAAISRMVGGHAAAAKAYERYLISDPLAESINLKLAESLEKADCGNSALAVYRAYAEQQPRCLPAARSAGLLLYEREDHAGALLMFEQALKVDPRDQESLRARKNLAAEGALKRTGLADAEHSRELMKDRSQQKKLEQADRLQLSADEIAAEIEELEAALQERPNDVRALQRLGRVHEMNSDPRSALDCLEQALQCQPDNSDLAAKAGDLRLRVQEARVRAAEKRGDESAVEFARKALLDMRLGEFRRRVQQSPTDLGLRYLLGVALAEAGEMDEAISELQQAVKDPRHKVDALVQLGRAFRAKGLIDLARTQFEKALDQTNPAGALGKEVLYELGSVAEQAGAGSDALAFYSRILEQDIGFRDVAEKVDALKA